MKPFNYHGINCLLTFDRYAINGSTCIKLIAAEDPGDDEVIPGEPITTATVAIATLEPPEKGQIFIKTWSENEGLLETFVHEGFVRDTGERIPCGRYGCEAAVCELLVKEEES